MKWIVPLALLLAAPLAAQAESTVALYGSPLVKIESGQDGTELVSMSPSQRQEFHVGIVKRDGRYFWSTREDRELLHTQSGAYHLFIDPLGGGYVKVEVTSLLLPDSDTPIRYIEHLSLGLATLTYWGTAEAFAP